MMDSGAACIQVQPIEKLPEEVKTVIETFNSIDDADVVVVPIKLFTGRFNVICDAFRSRNRKIIHDPQLVNVFTTQDDILTPTEFGKLDKLTERWTLQGTSKEFLDEVIERLSKRTTVFTLRLHEHKLKGNGTDITFIAFTKPCSSGMSDFIKQLQSIKTSLPENKKFAVEYDIAPAMQRWAKEVLKKDMTCYGGRLGVTNGDLFHPLFQWNVAVGCIPLMPISLVASLIYRATRKVKYHMEETIQPEENIVILGSESREYQDQQEALSDVNRMAVAMSLQKCQHCGYMISQNSALVPACVCEANGNGRPLVRRSTTLEMETFTQKSSPASGKKAKKTAKVNREDDEEKEQQTVLDEDTRRKIKEFHALAQMDVVTIDDRRGSFGGLSCFDLEIEDDHMNTQENGQSEEIIIIGENQTEQSQTR